MKRMLIIIFAFISVAFGAFAEPKSTGLTDSDVKNWAKNLSTIQKEFDRLGLNDEEIASASKKQYAQAESVLQKYGISGPNSVEKYAMINQCVTVLMAESEMGGMDAQSMAMMKAMGIDPLAKLKANINSSDFKVIKANEKAVIAAINGYADSLPTDSGTIYTESDPVAEHRAFMKQQVQPEIDKINKAAEPIKQVYEYLTTGKKPGAGKLLYPVEDKENASKYKKQKIDANQLPIEMNRYCIEYDYDAAYNESKNNEVLASINLKKKTAVFNISWTEAEFNEAYDATRFDSSPIKTTQFTKTVKTTIPSAELYQAKYNGVTSKEFTLTTKDGAVIHLWNSMSEDGNAYSSRVQFGEIAPPEDTNWYEDYGN